MPGPPIPESFDFQNHFDKKKICLLSDKIRVYISKTIPDTLLVRMNPWAIGFLLRTQNTEISALIAGVYKNFDEVSAVEVTIDHMTKCPVINIALSERWFVDEKVSRKHPEEEGGSLA